VSSDEEVVDKRKLVKYNCVVWEKIQLSKKIIQKCEEYNDQAR
jgi:hypothetical protein